MALSATAGSVIQGTRADLVLLNAILLKDIRNTRRINAVLLDAGWAAVWARRD